MDKGFTYLAINELIRITFQLTSILSEDMSLLSTGGIPQDLLKYSNSFHFGAMLATLEM